MLHGFKCRSDRILGSKVGRLRFSGRRVENLLGPLIMWGSAKKGELTMKSDIHPKYFKSTVTCGCGNTFETGSTKEKIAVEICSKCHPFFTGTQKFVDTAGRVEKFQKKFGGDYFKAKKPAKATPPAKA